jgi:integral membrane protein
MRWVVWLGWVEGLSAVLLMCIATPVKYLMDAPHMVEVLGPIHGALFMAYLFALTLGVNRWWDWRTVPVGFLAASFPGGAWWFDHRLSKGLFALDVAPAPVDA